jgi:hypothetical protein
MKLVYTSQDSAMMNHLKNLLEHCGIDCLVKNEFLRGALGEIPPIQCWPELWVMDDASQGEARKVVMKTLYFTPVGKPWTCTECGEVIGGQFTDCWKCAATPEKTQDGSVLNIDRSADKRRTQ